MVASAAQPLPAGRPPSGGARRLAVLAIVACAFGCGTAASTTLGQDDGGATDASTPAAAACSATGSVPGCPCTIQVPGTIVRIGSLACASGVGPEAVACGQKSGDGGVAFARNDASVWVPFFRCPGMDKCSAVTTYDELTCTDESSGAIIYYAILGAPCFHENEGACSLDLGTVLECTSGTWTAFTTCPKHSCIEQGDRPACAPG